MVLIDGLQSYYKLDEVSGTRADSVGTNHLSDPGDVGSEGGVINRCATFITGALSAGDVFENFSGITISCWTRQNIMTTLRTCVKWSDVGSAQRSFNTYQDANGSLNWLVYSNTSGGSIYIGASATALIKPNRWYHQVVSWNGTSGQGLGYLNNVKVLDSTNASVTGTIKNTTSNFEVGIVKNIDEVGIWNRVLTAPEIAELYNFGAGNGYPFGNSTALKFRS